MASRLGRVVRSVAPSPANARSLVAARHATSESAPPPAHRRHRSSPDCPHEYAKLSAFLGSWKNPAPSGDPVEAQRRLAMLRREYGKQVKQVRRQYAYEMELQRQEKMRKDEARREAARVAKEERKAAKAAAAEVAAAERKAFEEEFRQTLLNERSQKLESWRTKEELQVEKRGKRNELLHRQSSMWIDDSELDKKITEALVDTTQL